MDMKNANIAELDENTMAEMILDTIGEDNLFQHPSGTYIFKHHWKPLGKEALNNMVRKGIAQLNTLRKEYGHKAEKVTNSRVKGTAELLKMAAFRDDIEFNSGPRDVVSVANGDLVLVDGIWSLTEPIREHYRMTRATVTYDPDARAELFPVFLDSIFEGDVDALEKGNLLLKMMGLALMTDARFERFLFLLGMGANGKSVFLEVLRHFVGTWNTAAVHPKLFESSFHRQHMDGKLINVVTESAQGFRLPTAEVKALVSGEAMTVERKHHDPYVMKPFATFFWATNHLPHPSDYSNAIYRRTFILNFNQNFEHRADDELADKLKKELSGILNMVLPQLAALLKSGDFDEPVSSRQARERWRLEGDQSRLWLEQRTERDLVGGIGVKDAFDDYAAWAKENGYLRTMNQTSFSSRLEAAGWEKVRKAHGMVWRGLRVKK